MKKINWSFLLDKAKLFIAKAIRWLFTLVGILFFPIFVVAWFLHKIARLLLAISYLFMLDWHKAKDIIVNMFSRYGRL